MKDMDYIYETSNSKLAELLIETQPYSMEWDEIRNEAARRLRASDRKVASHFNDESFNI